MYAHTKKNTPFVVGASAFQQSNSNEDDGGCFAMTDYLCQQVFQSFHQVVFAEKGRKNKRKGTAEAWSKGAVNRSQELLFALDSSQSARMQENGRFVLNGLRKHTGTGKLNYGAL